MNPLIKPKQDTSSHSIFQELANNGVAHLRQFIPASDIRSIRNRLDKYNSLDGFETRDKDGKVQEFEWLSRRDPAILETLTFRRCFELANQIFSARSHFGFDHAIIKNPGSGPVHWHQDQFYSKLDRNKQCLSFWIPLQAVSPENGGMEYAVGPQKKLLTHSRVFAKSHAYHVTDLPPFKSLSPTMEMGDVCVHTPMTLHRSHPNRGTSDRLAWILQFNRYGAERFFHLGNLCQHLRRLNPVENMLAARQSSRAKARFNT